MRLTGLLWEDWDGEALEGMLERKAKPTADELWQQAVSENKGKPVSARRRYRELLREHRLSPADHPAPQNPRTR